MPSSHRVSSEGAPSALAVTDRPPLKGEVSPEPATVTEGSEPQSRRQTAFPQIMLHMGWSHEAANQGFSPLRPKRNSHHSVAVSFWSEWRDLNSRPHGPEPCALPAALHPVKPVYYNDCSGKCQEKNPGWARRAPAESEGGLGLARKRLVWQGTADRATTPPSRRSRGIAPRHLPLHRGGKGAYSSSLFSLSSSFRQQRPLSVTL